MKRIACGSTNLVEGKIIDGSGGTNLHFKPEEVSMWKAAFGIGVREISAAACVHCGHLHPSVSFSDEDRRNYRQLECQQPDLLKRIESEE